MYSRARLWAAALSLSAACWGMAAEAAEVTGTIQMPRKGAARDAVIYLEGGRKAAPLSRVVIDQREKLFIPHVTVVTQGTTVDFPNNDNILHNVFAYYNAKKFDLGVYPKGKSKQVTFDKLGVVAVLCNIHSEMSAYIVVVDTPYYSVTDRAGRFILRDVPPGAYKLHVWHETGARHTQSITVGAQNEPLSLQLTK